jgi:hypothetical protein
MKLEKTRAGIWQRRRNNENMSRKIKLEKTSSGI